MGRNITRHSSVHPSHPGELLREIVLPATAKTKTEIANLLGISRQALHDILNETQAVTPAMAMRLGKLFGDGPEVWLRMQAAYDLAKAEKELGPIIKKIPTLAA